MQKFRSAEDVSQYLFRYWDLASGNFEPIQVDKSGKFYTIDENYQEICDAIRKQKQKMICINDASESCSYEEFEQRKK